MGYVWTLLLLGITVAVVRSNKAAPPMMELLMEQTDEEELDPADIMMAINEHDTMKDMSWKDMPLGEDEIKFHEKIMEKLMEGKGEDFEMWSPKGKMTPKVVQGNEEQATRGGPRLAQIPNHAMLRSFYKNIQDRKNAPQSSSKQIHSGYEALSDREQVRMADTLMNAFEEEHILHKGGDTWQRKKALLSDQHEVRNYRVPLHQQEKTDTFDEYKRKEYQLRNNDFMKNEQKQEKARMERDEKIREEIARREREEVRPGQTRL